MKTRIYETSELKELQKIELEILKKIINVCEKNGIEYFVDGGTMLGAVRHGGFIPWDDDIDIAMFREDYDKFCKIANNELGDEYFFQEFKTDKNTPTFFGKVRKNGTLFVEEYYENINMNQGIFVDIFPYDRVSQNKRKQKNHEIVFSILEQMFVSKVTYKTHKYNNKFKNLIFKILRFILFIIMIPIPRGFIYNLMNKESQRFNCSENNPYYSNSTYYYNKYHYDDIFPVIKFSFENIVVNMPNKYDKILTIMYGDYMKFPPTEERCGHAPKKISFDLNKH